MIRITSRVVVVESVFGGRVRGLEVREESICWSRARVKESWQSWSKVVKARSRRRCGLEGWE